MTDSLTLFNHAGSGTDAKLTSIITSWDPSTRNYIFTPVATTPIGKWVVVVESKPPGFASPIELGKFYVTIQKTPLPTFSPPSLKT
jgi:hypothetical protein